MENKTVAELEAMTNEQIAALSPQEKANRTKTINASKPATTNSGKIADDAIALAAQQKANAEKEQAALNAKQRDEEKLAAQKKLKAEAEAAAQKEKEQALAEAKKKQEAADLAAQQQRLDDEQREADELEAEAQAKKQEADLIAKYGPGYIRAVNGARKTIFSATTWDLLGKNKEGWKPEVSEPAEVANFKNKGGNSNE